MEVLKIRASDFREGYHDYVIEKGGVVVFPRLISGEHRGHSLIEENLPSGVAGTGCSLQGRSTARDEHFDCRTSGMRKIDVVHSVCVAGREAWGKKRNFHV